MVAVDLVLVVDLVAVDLVAVRANLQKRGDLDRVVAVVDLTDHTDKKRAPVVVDRGPCRWSWRSIGSTLQPGQLAGPVGHS